MNMNKKTSLLSFVAACLISSAAFSQAIRDRNVIPVAVNLNEVLRMSINNGGNIEFVFNSIDDYRRGLSGASAALVNPQDATVGAVAGNPATTGGAVAANNMYSTQFTVASSTDWKITYGSEDATFIGTDDPANVLALNNVGFTLTEDGTHEFEATGAVAGTDATKELHSVATDNAVAITGLHAYPVVLVSHNDGTNSNAGDATDNSFSMIWRCGTTESPGVPAQSEVLMNALSLLNQGLQADRYVTNVVFELSTDL